MRPEIEKMIMDDPRILNVGVLDAQGGFWAYFVRGVHDHVGVKPYRGEPVWIRYRLGKRGVRHMLLLDFLVFGLEGEHAEGLPEKRRRT